MFVCEHFETFGFQVACAHFDPALMFSDVSSRLCAIA
jgi:hypothetical protein